MAKILSQEVHDFAANSLPISADRQNLLNFTTGILSSILFDQSWKSLSQIIDTLYEKLSLIDGLTLSEPDQNGNITTTIGNDIRLALALGITNTQMGNILLFGRKEWEKEYDEEGNKNPNLDLVIAAKAILSKGSISFKAGDDFLQQAVTDLSFTGKYAYEQTDGDGDVPHIIMPVFAGKTESIIQLPPDKKIQTISVHEFAQMSPIELTAKAEAYRQYINTLTR